MSEATFHSKHGGLWIDRSDFETELQRRQSAGELKAPLSDLVRGFARDGYAVLEGAANLAAVDAFQRRLASAFEHGDPEMLYQTPGSQTALPMTGGVTRGGNRAVDAFVAAPEALELFKSPSLIDFLHAIFDEDPLLFQSLSFYEGSGQGLHQDTAYVVVDRPLELVACWIALEDVRVGSGELMYVPGSHRFPDFDFGDSRKHWDPDRDGDGPHTQWSMWLKEEAGRRNLKPQTFLAKKGDIFIWHADLAHGGSPVADPTLTRQSLVGHFCPSSREPHYFEFMPQCRTIRASGRLRYSTMHYELQSLPPVEAIVETIPDEPAKGLRGWLSRLGPRKTA